MLKAISEIAISEIKAPTTSAIYEPMVDYCINLCEFEVCDKSYVRDLPSF